MDYWYGYSGFRVEPGPPLVLQGIADRALTVGRGPEAIGLAGAFPPSLGPADYAAESSGGAVAAVSVEDGALAVSPRGAGSATVTVTATAADGVTLTREFRVTVRAPSVPLLLSGSNPQRAQRRQGAVAAQAPAHRGDAGSAGGQAVGDQADGGVQRVAHEPHPASQPAHGAGQLDGVAADGVGRGRQAGRPLGGGHRLLQRVERPRQPRRQAVRQQAERGVALRAVPASDPRAPRRLAPVGAVPRQRAAAARVVRAPLKPCLAPCLGGNVPLAGKPRLVAKLHRRRPGGGPPRRPGPSSVGWGQGYGVSAQQ
ncbi:MAG: hypothetical protein OXG51_01120 [Gammaproteobacteria bacterium]|nr:hypothetical protein [Gammaproteobacteria bacterium]